MPGEDGGQAREAERPRRDFIREHHPDRGGDPELFIAGLRAFGEDVWPRDEPLPKVVVVRRRPWWARLVRAVSRLLSEDKRAPRVR